MLVSDSTKILKSCDTYQKLFQIYAYLIYTLESWVNNNSTRTIDCCRCPRYLEPHTYMYTRAIMHDRGMANIVHV